MIQSIIQSKAYWERSHNGGGGGGASYHPPDYKKITCKQTSREDRVLPLSSLNGMLVRENNDPG